MDLNSQDKEAKTPLHWATIQNNFDAVVSLVKAKAKLKIPDVDGLTALDYALLNGRIEIAAYLAIAILEEEFE